MPLEPQVTFKNVDPSDFILGQIQAHLTKLEGKFPGLASCRLVFERPRHRLRKGDQYRLDLVLALPGGIEIAVSQDALDDPKIAVREAFEMADRRIADAISRRQTGSWRDHAAFEEWEPS